MIKTGILKALTISVKNVFSKGNKALSNHDSDKAEESIAIYSNNRLKYSSILCAPTIPIECFEIEEDGYIKPI
ncbi:MAG: hypothetical protein QXT53_07080 [Ignisphaera sp.]